MYVCLCQGVTSKDIEDAVYTQKVKSFEALKKSLNACQQCGKCEVAARAVYEQAIHTVAPASCKTGSIITPIILLDS